MKKEKAKNQIVLFENKKIRRVWNNEAEKWFFSVKIILKFI